MPKQSPLRLIKRWKRYEQREKWESIPRDTRGVYALYKKVNQKEFCVVYVGVAGIGPTGGGGIRGRLKRHNQRIEGWTHFSCLEVHDNIGGEEIREIEVLLLGIFGRDPRIQLANVQTGSKKLRELRHVSRWAADNRPAPE